ncbi:MAG: glycosyltransferase family 39 protein [Nitrospirota bacterium]
MDILTIDNKLFFLINHGTANALFDVVMPFLSARGYFLLLPYIGYLVWTVYREPWKSSFTGFDPRLLLWTLVIPFCVFLVSDWLSYEIKNVVMRERPFTIFADARVLVGRGKAFSMPSSHATNYFAVAVALYYFTRNRIPHLLSICPFILATLVAFSRIYVGVHFPTDVIAGALFGAVIALLLIFLFNATRKRYHTKPYTTLLLAGLVVLSIFRIYYTLHGPLDLSPDEAHYWEWSRRLDLSYYSKGPMIAYLIYLGTALFGDTVFGIRIMAVIFSALSSIVLFKLVEHMYQGKNAIGSGEPASSLPGRDLGALAALLFQIIPLFATFGVVFTIDAPFVFFWILSLFLFYAAITSEQKNRQWMYWLLTGIAVGLGLLTKYTMALFYICAFLLLLSDKRHFLKTARPYIALLISLTVFSPVIVWNIQHNWVTVRHTAGQAHVAEGFTLSLTSFLEFLGSQIGIITPLLFGMMLYAIVKLKVSVNDLQSKFLFYFSVPVIGFFLVKSLQGKVQANWAMTGYITGLIAFTRYFLSHHPAYHTSRIMRYGVYSGVALALFFTAISHYPSLLNLPPKMDPSARLRGWKELGAEVSALHGSLAQEGAVYIFSDKYQVASALAFYVKGHPRTYSINLGRRMNQYDLWPDMNSDAVLMRERAPFAKIHGIFVTTGNKNLAPDIAASFDHTVKKVLHVYEGKRLLREYSIFICYNFRSLKTKSPETF